MNLGAKNTTTASALLPWVTSGNVPAWVEHWRRPKGASAVKVWLGLIVLILLVGAGVYATGGTGFVWVHMMYVPIILASGIFGIRGGLVSAVVAGLVVGPFMPLDIEKGIPQGTENWVLRSHFFLLAGGCGGLLFTWMNRQLQRLRQTHAALLRTHEELKAAQMRLIQNAKLESVGRLAAGVAHEVKNPLAVLQLGVDYFSHTLKADPALKETVQDMEDAIHRADAVIKGLLDFSRSEQLTLAPSDVNAILEETLALVKHELTKNRVTVEREFEANLPPVQLDRNKIKQVFINLFMNAIQAMGSEGGTLRVRTRRQRLTPEQASWSGGMTGGFLGGDVSPKRPGVSASGRLGEASLPEPAAASGGFRAAEEAVVVDVEDTGTGIAEDKLDKLFDPFFTTKAVGSGTGLGLSVSLKIIELHGAVITIANRKPKGATAQIIFRLGERKQS